MRALFGILTLGVLLLLLWRVWPSEAIATLLDPAAAARPAQGAPGASEVPAANALHVLFVGNSHTYANDMPKMIAELASAARPERPMSFAMEAAGGATLAQHLAQGRVARHLREGQFDRVVLQEQQQRPSFTFNRNQLEEQFFGPVRTLDVMARAAGASTVLHVTWARRDGDPGNVPGDDFDRMQERTSASFAEIAAQTGAALAPVGSAWRAVRRAHPRIALWAADGSHAAPAGSYLAACVLYGVLYDAQALGNPYTAGVPAGDARILQAAADDASRASRAGR